ncbi:uncharacterized protein HKW66_Vig0051780 [Vigna angularis]|uniref:CCHC-type domain-containing protein n=2 Tax=Phaseolus angularis TaxID=3914 RepID=A0A8T0L6H8_PHAAN|nr:uncharacterized protein HKW66_Vig0051780 [Vigna angularis]
MSVEEYRQKMELYMMRAGIREEEGTTISRFLSGLNLDIRDRVELLPYQDLNDLVQICIKVEQQHLRKGLKINHFNSSVKKDYRREGKQVMEEEPSRNLWKEKEKDRSREGTSLHTRTSEIKCFKCQGRGHMASQCPTKRTIILRDVDSYSSEEEEEKDTSKDESEGEDSYPCEGDLLMMRRVLKNQPSPQVQTQRENIFHTRCQVLENTCSLIVDSGSCCNCCSTRLVEKLALTILPHPQPYKLQWLNDGEDMIVNQQVKVKFSIGNYEDSVLCDIVPMEVCHILLGRPWLFEKETIHHGRTNEITFNHKDRKFVLHPLTPSQVEIDQVQMKNKREKERDDINIYKIKCSECQSNTHMSNECPNKRAFMLRATSLCEDSKGVFFPSSFSRLERQDQMRLGGKKGSHSKCICIQHKISRDLKGKYIIGLIILITLTLSLVFCRKLFDPGGFC